MIHAFGKTVELKINVEQEEILLLGHADEAAGKMLQGSLVLNLTEPIKVKSINLSFIGKMKVSWCEGVGHHQHLYQQERTILTHSWEFLQSSHPSTTISHKKSSTTLNTGQHKWDFELMLPGNLPQTLYSDVGNVSYQLKATIERSAFIQNTVKKRTVRIVRCILPTGFELVQSLEIHHTWAQKMVYDISVPSKLYAFNDTIPISFKILPIASHLRVHAIMASIKEYCTYTANDHTKTDTRIVKLVRLDDPFSSEAFSTVTSPPTWDRVLDFPLPAKSPFIFADAESEMIRIRHKLKYVISLVNADGHMSELRCAVQIIVAESFAVAEELTTLPAYDDMWRSVPYDTHVVETLRRRTSTVSEVGATNALMPQPVTTSGCSRLLSVSTPVIHDDEVKARYSSEEEISPGSNSSSVDDDDDDLDDDDENDTLSQQPLWWYGVDLYKVPSYRSSVSIIDPSMFAPAYDSLAAGSGY